MTYRLYSSVSLFICCAFNSSPKVAMPIATPEMVASATGRIRPAIFALRLWLCECLLVVGEVEINDETGRQQKVRRSAGLTDAR